MSFDPYAKNYDSTIKDAIGYLPMGHDFYLKAKLDALWNAEPSLLADRAGVSCLDFGCGIGNLHGYLKHAFPFVVGLDTSLSSLEQVPSPETSKLVQYDGLHLPFKDESFQLLVASCVFHHIPTEIRHAVLLECRRVLKVGGKIAIFEHNPFHPLTRLTVSRCEFDKDAELLSAATCRHILTGSGFGNPRAAYYLFHPLNLPEAMKKWEYAAFHRLPLGAQYLCLADR